MAKVSAVKGKRRTTRVDSGSFILVSNLQRGDIAARSADGRLMLILFFLHLCIPTTDLFLSS